MRKYLVILFLLVEAVLVFSQVIAEPEMSFFNQSWGDKKEDIIANRGNAYKAIPAENVMSYKAPINKVLQDLYFYFDAKNELVMIKLTMPYEAFDEIVSEIQKDYDVYPEEIKPRIVYVKVSDRSTVIIKADKPNEKSYFAVASNKYLEKNKFKF